MKITGDEPAYPVTNLDVDPNSNYRAGLSIRQHLASLAMQAIVTGIADTLGHEVEIAKRSISLADALIVELDKTFPEAPVKTWI